MSMHCELCEARETIKYLVLTFVGRGQCYTLPNGDCIGVECIHSLLEPTLPFEESGISPLYLELLQEEEEALSLDDKNKADRQT